MPPYLLINTNLYNSFSFLSASIGGEIKPSVIKCPAAAQVSWILQKEEGENIDKNFYLCKVLVCEGFEEKVHL